MFGHRLHRYVLVTGAQAPVQEWWTSASLTPTARETPSRRRSRGSQMTSGTSSTPRSSQAFTPSMSTLAASRYPRVRTPWAYLGVGAQFMFFTSKILYEKCLHYKAFVLKILKVRDFYLFQVFPALLSITICLPF